jgi:hypothetical protein
MSARERHFKTEKDCSFCGHPEAPHEGGAEFDGGKVTGNFCNKSCFDSWLKWKYALITANIIEGEPA